MPLHADQLNLSMVVGENIRLAGELGLLTDTDVQNATTAADLKNSIDSNAAGKHADQQYWAGRLKTAIDRGKDDGTLNDTDIQAATGVASLASLTQSQAGKVGPILE